ncbi:MAG: 4-hydroxythreonine-4-phosphate dehydrogenase PdxA [Gammaproteobacteria bacterium]|nr:4-hydroxythreonine-4-phosphate dehydrogenase PdxA [Gammaproteobacteria bacterium]
MDKLPCLILTAGEPAGIGPDLCLALANQSWPARLAVAGDIELLQQRAQMLGMKLSLRESALEEVSEHEPGSLQVLHRPLASAVVAGRLNTGNAGHVLQLLDLACDACTSGLADAMVTAPLQKSVINDAGIAFTGHTEYLARRTGASTPVMLLTSGKMKVALATTHLPLREVADAITAPLLEQVLEVLLSELQARFGIAKPRLMVCGLNPHAGESGHLGREEQTIITPVLDAFRARGIPIIGPVPADTAFTPAQLARADAVLAMYHDQGLPVIKHAGFGEAVNVTLGLPVIRTSVDHGTALELAGTGHASAASMEAAVRLAIEMANHSASAGQA